MVTKRVEELTAGDLRRFQTIRAVAADEGWVVWDSKRLLPFVAPGTNAPGTLLEELDVSIGALDRPSVTALQDRIAALEGPEFGRRRLLAVETSLLDE